MRIACLSGKGGAGKTFVAVNLAATAGKCTYIDCDVEEPNGHLFWKPQNLNTQVVTKLLPSFDVQKCTGCRKCVDFCQFHALVYIKEKPMLFSEVCHSCGGCKIVCTEDAVLEVPKPIGVIDIGTYDDVTVVTGNLNIGEASGVPIIRESLLHSGNTTILDCPPGSACSVMESIMDADYCVLVVEPTAFGFHNFKMVYELVTLLDKRCGIIINKYIDIYEPLETFCLEHNLTILDRILYQPEWAEQIASGEIISLLNEGEHLRFSKILEKIGGAI